MRTPQFDEGLVSYTCEDAVATITLQREQKLNAFNAALVQALAAALRQFDEDAEAQVAVLTGAGRAFSTGADVRERQARSIEELAQLGGPQEPDAHSYQLFNRSVNWKPVISAVHGHVLGLGLGIAFETDLIVAEQGTQFQITETPRGLGGARYWGLLRFCGATAFGTEVALTGRYFTAEEALAHGLIARVADVGEAISVAHLLARQIAKNPPLSVRATVRVRRWFVENVCREIAAQTDPLKLYLTADFREAVSAHLEKRSPSPFVGR